MKDKFIFFVIGLLVGAIISTASIYFYTLANSSDNDNPSNMGMQQGNPPDMPNGNNNQNGA